MTELKYINKEENKSLQIKDLITLGLYTILLILVMAVGIGISTLLTAVVFGGKVYFATYTSITAALVCGSVYSLIFNKINTQTVVFYLKITIWVLLVIYFYLTFSTNFVNSAGLFNAKSAKTFLSSSIPAFLSPFINLE